MTLKGNVIRVLVFLLALIGCAGTTVFAGLQFGQVELDVIAIDASRLDSDELPFLIAAQTLNLEIARTGEGSAGGRGAGMESSEIDRLIRQSRDVARTRKLDEALALIDRLERELRERSPERIGTAAALMRIAEDRVRDRAAALAEQGAWLGNANLVLAWLVLGFTGIGLSIAVWGAITLYRRIRDSIALTQADIGILADYASSEEVSDDAIHLALDDGSHSDEFGEIGRALAQLAAFLVKGKALARDEVLRREERLRQAEQLEALSAAFSVEAGEIIRTVSAASTELEATARSMAASAEETSRQSSAVAAAATQASTNVQTVATAAEQLGASITEIGRQASRSAGIAGRAVVEAEQAGEVVRGLSGAVLRIGEVVTLINDIAGQTNLLALNATIEASRAGEAGKGFAVVAQEVKNLATETARATGDIGQQISSVQEETRSAVDAIEAISGTIGEMSDIVASIASAVEEQNAATGEINRNIRQAASGTDEVSSNIRGVSRVAQDTGVSSVQVLTASGDLNRQAERLRAEIEQFIHRIQAA